MRDFIIMKSTPICVHVWPSLKWCLVLDQIICVEESCSCNLLLEFTNSIKVFLLLCFVHRCIIFPILLKGCTLYTVFTWRVRDGEIWGADELLSSKDKRQRHVKIWQDKNLFKCKWFNSSEQEDICGYRVEFSLSLSTCFWWTSWAAKSHFNSLKVTVDFRSPLGGQGDALNTRRSNEWVGICLERRTHNQCTHGQIELLFPLWPWGRAQKAKLIKNVEGHQKDHVTSVCEKWSTASFFHLIY